jgi:c-di-GMP-binding flagellar brake protein YcgR
MDSGTLIAVSRLNHEKKWLGMTKERRSHPRVKVSHPVLYCTDISPTPRLATIVDLSMGGAAIRTPHRLTNGQVIWLTMIIDRQVTTCRGSVVHVLLDEERPMAGVRFERMSQQVRVHLGEHISHLLEQRNHGINGTTYFFHK